MGLVPSCHRAVVGSEFFSWLFCGSQIFSRDYIVGLKVFLVGISSVPKFFSWVLRGSNIFSSEYFVGPNYFLVGYVVIPKVFLVGITWFRNFFSCVFSWYRSSLNREQFRHFFRVSLCIFSSLVH